MDDVLICAENIKKSYERKSGRLEILRNVSLTVKKGESISIVGKSGSGKSTLISILALLMSPTEGKLLYCGKDALLLKDDEKTEIRRTFISYMFQNSLLFEDLNALENVAMPLLIRGEEKKKAYAEAKNMLSLVQMDTRLSHLPSELSLGERQRVALSRALITRPSVLFLDEPTGSLDEKSRAEVERLLFDTQLLSTTSLVLVTHDMDLAGRAERRMLLSGGSIEEIR
ncbi:MAG TPA: ABC transporter ATP-binding protein [Candidatus Ornithospirochaeta avicola]|uniref:ABC transporter ATP-binding protein n=1 Tax=Candidatus Ornithospirochaeta avicola TaxID=2840896 RepID=A0A9D1PUF2_9SPIO|nr:ABC transporter ATP-binding protein [Candidatus Ornithospirochaeta avicola]